MAVNYLNALGALVVGYRHLHLVDDWIAAAKRMGRRAG
jgi:hypothetical protein